MGIFKRRRPETSKPDGVKQPPQPKQTPMTAEEGREKALKMLEMPIEYRDEHGRTCQKIIKVVPICTHTEKPAFIRFPDCWECAIVHPDKCDPVPTIERLPADSLPCRACLDRDIEAMGERHRAEEERKERAEEERRKETAWMYDKGGLDGWYEKQEKNRPETETETKNKPSLLNSSEEYDDYHGESLSFPYEEHNVYLEKLESNRAEMERQKNAGSLLNKARKYDEYWKQQAIKQQAPLYDQKEHEEHDKYLEKQEKNRSETETKKKPSLQQARNT